MNIYDPTERQTFSDASIQYDEKYSGSFCITFKQGNAGISINYFFDTYAEYNPQLVTYIQTHYPEVCV